MITPAPIPIPGTPVDISVVAAGTIYTQDGKTFFIKTSMGNVVNLSNGQEQPAPPTPTQVTPMPTANLAFS